VTKVSNIKRLKSNILCGCDITYKRKLASKYQTDWIILGPTDLLGKEMAVF